MAFACVFPGQGSQKVGMLSSFVGSGPEIMETFQEASDWLTYDLWKLTQEGPEATLDQTEFTQPALLAADVAMYRVLQKQVNLQPQFLAGHSLGEYAALVCGDALLFKDAVRLVQQRARRMQATQPLGNGGMAVIIGLDEAAVTVLCEEVSRGESLDLANFNAPGQIVIAGHTAAVQRAVVLAERMGARLAKILPVSVPCHCRLLTEAAEQFAADLKEIEISAPKIPILHNAELNILNSPEEIRTSLQKQLYHPVRWTETIQWLVKAGVRLFVECGPGTVLTGLNKRIDKTVKCQDLNSPNALYTLEAYIHQER